VNLRFVVFSAHLRSYVMHLPRPVRLLAGYLSTDMTYVLFVRRFSQPPVGAAQGQAQLAYLAGNGIDPGAVGMAVLVQRMVPAEAAGVIFTANPLNGLKCQMLVNSARGTGEALVSGRAEPEQLVLEKSTGAAVSGRAGLMNGRVVRRLAGCARKIEKLFGSPQDIEFALCQGRLSILQSRPITGLPEPRLPYPVIWGKDSNRKFGEQATLYWSNWNTRENMPYPLKPLSWSFLNDLLFPAIFRVLFGAGPDSLLYEHCFIVDLVNGRAYWNMNRLFGHPFFGPMMRPLLKHLDREAGETFEGLLRAGRLVPQKPGISALGLAGEFVKALKIWAGFPWLSSIGSIEAECLDYWKRADWYNSFPLEGLTNLDLLRRAREFGYETARAAFPLIMVSGKALWGMMLVERLAGGWKDLNLDHLLAGIPGNKTTEGALELFRLSRMPPAACRLYEEWDGGDFHRLEAGLGANDVGREHLCRLRDFLERHGHRGLKDLDFAYPSWGEDRGYVHRMIKSYLEFGPDEKDPLTQYEESRQHRLALTAEIERRLGRSFVGPIKVGLFRLGLNLAQDHFPLRENEKYYGLRCFPGSRRIVLEIGRRYQQTGHLERPEDIFYLTVPEIEGWEATGGPPTGQLAGLIRQRQDAWQDQVGVQPPFLVRSDGAEEEFRPAAEDGAGRLQGVPASPGMVRGRACIIREPGEAGKLRKGEILVAPYTEGGWTPMFLLAKALVMEVGGPVCHGAIVAREYGIPAVVGVRGATARIGDGDDITVDGTRGEVTINDTSNDTNNEEERHA
jgi:pyruvate,water dikinase